MADQKNIDHARRLVRRRGRAPSPSTQQLVTEVRSEGIAHFPEVPDEVLEYCVGGIVVEWVYSLPWTDVDGFHKFLKSHEAEIAAFCEDENTGMEGVHYKGTFLLLDNGQPRYHTYFAYDDESTLVEWEDRLKNQDTFYDLMTTLRSYWARDPNATERRLAAAVVFEDPATAGNNNEFLALTIKAARLPRE
jgi:hypothetical protein